MIVGEKTNTIIWHELVGENAEEIEEEMDVFVEERREGDGIEIDGADGHDRTLTSNEFKLWATPSKGPECTKMVKNTQPVDELEVAVTSDIEREQVESALNIDCSSINNDEEQKDKKTRQANSLQVPLLQLEVWSTTLRSLIKGKKKFQHQDLINLKNTLDEIYHNRANIAATSSLAQEVYKVSQLEAHDVPNKDELRLRASAGKSTRYWDIRRHEDV
ncbi:hypothetical protein BYT27DRAFT_7183494 [Phlegmacium glaucopus]|nr:hypothetical protein BYT27DRAFT_7183494 [Phlegmacium glaucopus]